MIAILDKRLENLLDGSFPSKSLFLIIGMDIESFGVALMASHVVCYFPHRGNLSGEQIKPEKFAWPRYYQFIMCPSSCQWSDNRIITRPLFLLSISKASKVPTKIFGSVCQNF